MLSDTLRLLDVEFLIVYFSMIYYNTYNMLVIYYDHP
jgi:hypothetical protein